MRRPSGRRPDELRPVRITRGYTRHAEGSVLVEFGDTQVICTASVEEQACRRFLQGQGQGWVTAEYGMLPRSTNTRSDREAARGKQSGRTQEIQRLIGRALRAVVDLDAARRAHHPPRLRRDPGRWRHAHRSITGAFVALHDAHRTWSRAERTDRRIADARISSRRSRSASTRACRCSTSITPEDSACDTDMNVVMTGSGGIVEVQGTAEGAPFSRKELDAMLALAEKGIRELIAAQKSALAKGG